MIYIVGKTNDDPYQTCPRCKQQVRSSQMAEHIRIELLDPKYKDQRALFEERQRETNLVSGDVAAASLEKLTAARADLTDGKLDTKSEIPQNKVIWDGTAQTAVAAQNQMNKIAEKEQFERDRNPKRVKIDPNMVLKSKKDCIEYCPTGRSSNISAGSQNRGSFATERNSS